MNRPFSCTDKFPYTAPLEKILVIFRIFLFYRSMGPLQSQSLPITTIPTILLFPVCLSVSR